MKILHCIPSMLGGGAERQLAYLAGGLVALGHEVHVALCREGPNSALLRAGGATVHGLPMRDRWDPRVLRDLVQVIGSTRTEIVQTWLTRMDTWGGLAARVTRRPWIHSERYVSGTDHSVGERLLDAWLRHATAVVANSENGAIHWRADQDGGGVYVVPNALPADEIDAAVPCPRASLGVAEEAEVVLYTGRFVPQKNITVLAQALERLLDRRPRAAAVCCGEGPLREGFRARMDARGMGARCVTPGYRTDVWSVMKSAEVFVSASLAEGRPNAVHEAMLAGCPMVLSDIPQHREFVPADGALFFSTDDPVAAANALETVLTDPVGARERAARARTAAEGLTVAAMAHAYEKIYREILGRSQR